MDVLFTDEEMAHSCYVVSSKSTKPPLNQKKVQLIDGKLTLMYRTTIWITIYMHIECIDRVLGAGQARANGQEVRKKCNQKCIDKGRRHPP